MTTTTSSSAPAVSGCSAQLSQLDDTMMTDESDATASANCSDHFQVEAAAHFY